ncbi:hypothetical protein AB4K20DRAFT_1883323, partial [Rhizopus microsporus]
MKMSPCLIRLVTSKALLTWTVRNLRFSEFINKGERHCQVINKLWKEKFTLLAQQGQA